MLSKMVKLTETFRFHARPAGVLASAAKKYESMIMFVAGEKFADAKNFASVMALGRPEDGQIELFVDGKDESAAIEHMEKLLITLE